MIFGRSKFGRFAGANTAWDFVETPSQTFENWVLDSKVLIAISEHYRERKKVPQQWIENILAVKNLNASIHYARQIFFGALDMHYHTRPVFNTTAIIKKLQKKITKIEMIPGTHFQASFGHLMGYDAGYYGYLWSRIYAEDIFGTFLKGGLFNARLGRRYRREILEKARGSDEIKQLQKFLGRKPNENAFLKSIGI